MLHLAHVVIINGFLFLFLIVMTESWHKGAGSLSSVGGLCQDKVTDWYSRVQATAWSSFRCFDTVGVVTGIFSGLWLSTKIFYVESGPDCSNFRKENLKVSKENWICVCVWPGFFHVNMGLPKKQPLKQNWWILIICNTVCFYVHPVWWRSPTLEFGMYTSTSCCFCYYVWLFNYFCEWDSRHIRRDSTVSENQCGIQCHWNISLSHCQLDLHWANQSYDD